MKRTISDYKDILNEPRPVSTRHAPMSVSSRAAQFAPFAALTGYDTAIHEASRYTQQRLEPAEDQKLATDSALQYIACHIEDRPEASVRFFLPDKRKSGGRYIVKNGRVSKFDTHRRLLILDDGTPIPIDNIFEIQLT